MYSALRFKKQDRIMMTTLLRKLWMNMMKLWKGTPTTLLGLLRRCSLPSFSSCSAALLPFLSLIFLYQLLLLFSLPFFLFLLVLFLLLFLSLLALTQDYPTPSPPLSLSPPTFRSSPHPSPTAPSLFPFSPHPPLFSSQPFIFLCLLLLPFAFFLFFVPLKVTALLQDLPSPSWLKKKYFSEFSRLSVKS